MLTVNILWLCDRQETAGALLPPLLLGDQGLAATDTEYTTNIATVSNYSQSLPSGTQFLSIPLLNYLLSPCLPL